MTMTGRDADFGSRAAFAGATVLVCGARVAGASAARALTTLGATVLVTDTAGESVTAGLPAGARFVGALTELPATLDCVVTSPGLRPGNPLLVQAGERGLPVFGELEFAWRIRGERPARWLMITGTNGKTTTVRMLESILREAGLHALAVGNVGVPVIDAVMAEPPYDVLAVEASSFQLHHSSTLAPHAGALLNLAADHLDWHGDMQAYASDKTKVWGGALAIGNADDPLVEKLISSVQAPVVRFGLGPSGPQRFGVVDGDLRDPDQRVILPVSAVGPPGAHNIANALAASALAESVGLGPGQIARGLRAFVPDRHRNDYVATVAGVRYVDDSKATNPHAAAASLAAYDDVVWIAGGQLKDAPVEDLVRDFGPRLRGVVLLGVDQPIIAEALARHAPDVPVTAVTRTDDRAMRDVVLAATSLARAGDVVLLAPAAASLDMYSSYSARGIAFADAVRALVSTDRPGTADAS